jgi:hypothetical protein
MDTLLLWWKEKSAGIAAEIGVSDDVVFWGFPVGFFMFLLLGALIMFSGNDIAVEHATQVSSVRDVFSVYR